MWGGEDVPCTLMALHTAACVLALILYERAVRLGRIKAVRCLKEEVHCAPLSASFGRRFCLEENLEYFVGPECFSIPPEAASLSACVRGMCLSVFVYLEHVGTNSLRTTNEQLPYHQSRLSRLCELYYNRYLHTLRGLQACMNVRMHRHPHMHSFFQTATAEEQLRQRQLSLISLYLRHLFLAYSFPPLSLHTFSLSLSLSLFPIQSLSHLLPLSALPTCHRDFTPKRSDVFFFCFIFISHFWRVHLFEIPPQRIHITGFFSVHQPEKLSPTPHLHPHPIHHPSSSQRH